MSKHSTKTAGEQGTARKDGGPPRTARILIADVDTAFRRNLRKKLAVSMSSAEIGEVEGGEQALFSLANYSWDVVLLELDRFGKSGMDLLKQMVATRSGRHIVVLTTRGQSRFAQKALHAGASGYVLKGEDMGEIVAAVKSVLAGESYLNATMAEPPASIMNPSPEQAPLELLSEREYQVMKLIALGKSVKEIAFELKLSVKTVNTYRTRIMDKANLRTTADIIRYSASQKYADGDYLEGS